MNKSRIFVLTGIAIAIAAFFALGGPKYLSFEQVKSHQAAIDAWYASNPLATALCFFAVYVAVTGLSLPGATIMTLAAGAIFGLGWGTVLVSFASSLGATLAFLASRFLLRDWVQERFATALKSINEGVEKEGAIYLFTLRLIPVVPFFVINLAMGLTKLRAWTFYWVSQVGMLAGTLVYVNAGTQLAQLQSLSGILSPGLIGAFALLGIFPLAASRILDLVKARKVYARWTKPAKFDRNMVVIGAGSGGLVAALIAAVVKAKVTIVEKHEMGGDCLNTGCVPSKALIRTARVLAQMRRAKEYGLKSAVAEFDFAEVMERVQRVVKTVAPHDSVERFTGMGVECVMGEAKMISPWEVEIRRADGATQRLTTRSIVIAAGAAPFVPPIPGLAQMGYLTSESLWDLRQLPARLVILGGGPIGCELAQAFARFGAKVTQVEMLPRIMIREDPEVSELVTKNFRAEGVDVLVGHKAKQFLLEDGRKALICEHQGAEVRIEFDEVLVAVGRAPRSQKRRPCRPTNTCRRTIRTSMPAATWPARTSSRTPRRTRPGMPRSTLCSGASGNSARTTLSFRGRLSPIRKSPASGSTRPRRRRKTSPSKSRCTASTTSIAPSPTRRRTASSRCSPSRARTASSA